ncbi:hypothetical protein GCM10023198_48620 [Promicromonospora umidemergens]|uniref:Uncharacterized protein n=1 Tax=Promicromonospora umidemergens TaxID=629679 RepID=A0ABP8Y2A0_9MICO
MSTIAKASSVGVPCGRDASRTSVAWVAASNVMLFTLGADGRGVAWAGGRGGPHTQRGGDKRAAFAKVWPAPCVKHGRAGVAQW